MSNNNQTESGKKIAGERAVEFVREGMIVGLGTGTTVTYAIKKLSGLLKNGLNIRCVSTSNATTKLADSLGIPLVSINDIDKIDLTIDGADEVDKNFNGIKGGGGALLFEKIVAISSKKNVWIIDANKMVDKLGKFPLPVEVVSFGYKRILKKFEHMNLNPRIREKESKYFKTDSGNFIIDLDLKVINNPEELNRELKLITGVVETGLFIDIADVVIMGKNNEVSIISKQQG